MVSSPLVSAFPHSLPRPQQCDFCSHHYINPRSLHLEAGGSVDRTQKTYELGWENKLFLYFLQPLQLLILYLLNYYRPATIPCCVSC